MVIQADWFKSITRVLNTSTAKVVFEKGNDVVADIEIPISALENGIPEMRRIVEAERQKRAASSTGIEPISYSLVQGIKPVVDVVGACVYLILDPGHSNQISYKIPMPVALPFVIELANEIQKWTNGNENAPKH
jgi:hypothetical protein